MKKRLAALLCCAVTLFSACAGSGGSSGSAAETPQEQAKGRYLETELTFPGEAEHVYDLRQDESGALEAFAFIGMGKGCGNFRSEDGGVSWTQNSPAWLEALEEKSLGIDHASYLEDGGFFVTIYGGEGEPDGYRFDAAGTATPIEALPTDTSGAGVNGLLEADNGDLLFCNYFSVSQTDNAFQLKNTYEAEGWISAGSYADYGETLVLCDQTSLRRYSLADGSLLEEIPQNDLTDKRSVGHADENSSSQASRLVAVDEKENAIYYCDSTGIYRRLIDGSVSERLVDGELSSLCMPTVSLSRLYLCPDGDFLVWAYNDQQPILLRYHYNEEAATVPSTELKLYSLEENKTVRQAIGMFQRQNPDVKVTYEVGAADDTTTAADALRTFNTRLLAGDGPDVIILDGLPLNSYIEKDVLGDLSEALTRMEPLLSNAAGAFQRDNKLYALPARFSVPMLGVNTDAASKITDLDSLAVWLKQQSNPALYCTVPEGLLEALYPVLSPGWFQADGSLDEEALSRSLTLLKQLSEITGLRNEGYQSGSHDAMDLEFGAVAFSGGGLSANWGSLNAMKEAAANHAAFEKLGGGELIPLAGEEGAVFVPSAILGINTGSKQQDLALKFISFALSRESLAFALGDGLPTNLAALRENAKNPYTAEQIEMGQGTYYSMGVTVKDENGNDVERSYELRSLWPPETYMNDLVAALETIETASPVDQVILQMILTEAADYFAGDKTLEDTVDGFAQKLTIYLSE